MGVILKALTGPLGSYIMIAVAVVIAGMAITIKVQHSSNVELRDKLAVSQYETAKTSSANESQSKAIGDLEKSVTQWKEQCTTSAEQAQQAASRADQYALDRERLAAQLATLEAKDHEAPNCKAILDSSLDAVCPGISNGLRKRATNR